MLPQKKKKKKYIYIYKIVSPLGKYEFFFFLGKVISLDSQQILLL